MDKQYDVFISYSRWNLDLVRCIKEALEEATGVECWMDLNAIESGSSQFSQDIVEGIDGCKVFLFMLSKQSQNSEYALLELNYARKMQKHVVMVNIDDCDMVGAFLFHYSLTDQIAWNDQPQREKLLRDLKRWTHHDPEKEPETLDAGEKPIGEDAFLKLKSDLDCTFYLDGEEKATLQANKLLKFALRKGEYELKFVSLENEKDVVVEDFSMPAMDKRYDVKLLPIRERRLKQERAKAQSRAELDNPVPDNPQTNPQTDSQPKKGLWIAFGAAAVVALVMLLVWPKKNPPAQTYSQTETSPVETTMPDLTITANGVSFVMKPVEGGTFWMGAQSDDPNGQNYDSEAGSDENPVHSVTVSTFYLGETEVTQALWKAVMGTTISQQRDKGDPSWPLKGEGDNFPMYYVSWDECQEFVMKLNNLTGRTFRLPTEAEWEFAARGGNKSNGYKYPGSNSIGSVAWYIGNSGDNTHEVKGKSPNELGLYDMSGNVFERCNDWWGNYGSGLQTNPNGPSIGSYHMSRGGCWGRGARDCRVSYRSISFGDRGMDSGFRLCLPQ